MKILFTMLAICLYSFQSFAQKEDNYLIGKWQEVSKSGKIAIIDFIDSINVTVQYESSPIFSLVYEIIPGEDTQKINFKFENADEKIEFSGLFKILKKNQMKFQLFFEKTDFINFVENDTNYDPPMIITRTF